jgi:hypothetical protein
LEFDVGDRRVRLRNWFAILAQTLQVQLDCFPDVALNLFNRPARRDASRQIPNIGRKIVFAALDDDGVLWKLIPG